MTTQATQSRIKQPYHKFWSNVTPNWVKYVSETDYDLNEQDLEGQSILMSIVKYGRDPKVVTEMQIHGTDFNAQDNKGMTAIHYAAMYNDNPHFIHALMYGNININAQDDLGRTAFMLACGYTREVDVLITLIERGADVTLVDNEGRDALEYGASNKVIEQQITDRLQQRLNRKGT